VLSFFELHMRMTPSLTCRFFVLSLCLGLPACKTEHEQELESTVAELQAKLEEVKSHLSDTESAISELRTDFDTLTSTVEDFNYMNWRSVVPRVRDATVTLDVSLSDAESAISNAVTAAD
jgi:uncharacterized coiled-coil protein SlyX